MKVDEIGRSLWRPQPGRHATLPRPGSSSRCASAAEIRPSRSRRCVQELTDAALTCGPVSHVFHVSRFQIVFQKELRRSDAMLKAMFKRLNGNRARAMPPMILTRPAPSIMPNSAASSQARRPISARPPDLVFAAALAPDKPVLEDFVSGVPVNEASPVDSCEIKVAVALAGRAGGT